MNTEITENKNVNGWVLYDADCPFCIRVADRLRPPLARHHLELLPLQTPWIRNTLALNETELLSEMRLLKPEGSVFGGVDAWLEISRHFWWTWPLRQISRIPPIRLLLHRGYRWIARNRHCISGTCKIKPSTYETAIRRSAAVSQTSRSAFYLQRLLDFLPLLILPLLALIFRNDVAPWAFMWLMAFAIFYGCKWLTYRIAIHTALRTGARAPAWRRLGYLLAWPGMNAKEFFNPARDTRRKCSVEAAPRPAALASGAATATPLSPARHTIEHPEPTRTHESLTAVPLGSPPQGTRPNHKSYIVNRKFIAATAKTLFGATLLWVVARLALPQSPLLAGWLGMIGVIFLIHFGAFHLLQLMWQAAGINATPVMNNPIRATSLREFWGARWNTAFNELAFRFGFRPLRRWTTPATATLLVFLVSGLIHDLLISLPARGGYGLPTLYFLVQGAGIQIERSRLGKKFGLGHGVRGWLFTLLITAGPAGWLFHPPFIHHIILPMLTAIGAT